MRALALCSASVLLWSAGALAADSDSAEALFREGRRDADAGNYAMACPKFVESYRLDPALGTLLNLGDCEENRGQLVRAWQHFRLLYDLLPPADTRRSVAEARARALELRAPRLRIALATSAPAIVIRDEAVLDQQSLGTSVPVDPGLHVVLVTSPGRREKRYEVLVVEGDDKQLSVSAGDPLPDTEARTHEVSPPLSPPLSTPLPAKDRSFQRTAAFAVGGTGVASLVTGTVLGVVALSHLATANSGCSGNVCANQDALSQYHGAQSFAVAADVTLGVGLVLIGTAVVLLLTSPRDHGSRLAFSPMGGQF